MQQSHSVPNTCLFSFNSIQSAEHLTVASLARSGDDSADRANSKFKEDESIPSVFRSKLQDYFRSGYDRGHMYVEFIYDLARLSAHLSQFKGTSCRCEGISSALSSGVRILLSNLPILGCHGRNFLPYKYRTPSRGWFQQTLCVVLHPSFGKHLSHTSADWAYLEDWCRRLTKDFQDVYVFTVPLYLPKQDPDGKWRVVSPSALLPGLFIYVPLQTHEVIGSPPNVSVPTHFAKVILTTKPSSPRNPEKLELSTGAFVLPNAIIPDNAPLTSFIVPG